MRCCEINEQEEQAEHQIDAAEQEIVRVHASLLDQDEDSDAIAELFKNGWQHQQAITRRVARNYKERKLPSQSRADEPVEKRRMRDGRRVHLADPIKNKVEWGEHENAPDSRNEEYDFRDSHRVILLKWLETASTDSREHGCSQPPVKEYIVPSSISRLYSPTIGGCAAGNATQAQHVQVFE
jgi:hypothetical protein